MSSRITFALALALLLVAGSYAQSEPDHVFRRLFSGISSGPGNWLRKCGVTPKTRRGFRNPDS